VSAFGNNTGIVVPVKKIAALGAGQRPAVMVILNGYEYPNTVGVMGGKHLISVSAAVRKQTGLAGGDPVRVTLTLADGPRKTDIPTTSKQPWTKRPRRKRSSEHCPTACSDITSTRSTAPRLTKLDNAASTKPSPRSSPANSASAS
jgi:hypothetical protein